MVLQALGVLTECETSSQGRTVAFNVGRYKAEKDVCVQKRLCTPCLECQKQDFFIHLFSLLQMLGKSPSYPLRVRMTAGPAAAEGTVTPAVTPWALLPGTALFISVRALDFAAQPRDWCTALAVINKLCLDFWVGFNVKYSKWLPYASCHFRVIMGLCWLVGRKVNLWECLPCLCLQIRITSPAYLYCCFRGYRLRRSSLPTP